ncbi:MAG: hypothetical protein GAK31_03915 [Stenotrophomonas maltophilia]|uniref:Haem-binding uptake Tiki superfamily ChaN domain-containing protein n=1 Tax=Stenotrophomonas maltophilia TaxID=40324 RepID=A0A7V8JK39_STEMA|nr:MAG: hypothetical protein GAK31_03915 [Stenotrophomonas maltophilia]
MLAPLAGAQALPGRVIDLATGQPLEEEAFVVRAAAASHVLLGERHDLPGDHAAERWLLQALQTRRPQGSLVLEMIASERQPRLQRVQRWLAKGNTASHTRLAELLEWDPRWPWSAYGGLVSAAAAQGIALHGGNLARREVDTLLAQPPAVVFPVPGARVRLAQTVLNLHDGAEPLLEGMLAVQQARDQRMAQVLQQAPAPVLLVAGCWHVLRGTGVPGYLPADRPALVIELASPGETLDASDADLAWVQDDE